MHIPDETGYAASTMATDGRRVYAIFATGDLAAFTLAGKLEWTKHFGAPKNPHGHASSLVTWQDQVIVQLDQGEAEQNISKLYAIEGRTGRVRWQRSRPVSTSWATPSVIETGGRTQIVALAVPWIMAYDAKDGSERWRVDGLAGEVTPSAVYAGGLVLAASPNDRLFAIRPEGQGDVTKSHVAWTVEDSIPDIASPVSDGKLVFTLSTPGMLTCYDLSDGKKHWEQDLEMECNASPVVAGGRLYIASIKGQVVVVEAAVTYRELSRANLGEAAFASPAFVRGRIYWRTKGRLLCIGGGEKLAQTQ
jgi:outer membrane protein assembly factor BamB